MAIFENESPTFAGDPNAALLVRAKRARELQKAMAARSATPQGQMIGDVYVPPSVLSNIAALGNYIGADRVGSRADAQEAEAKAAQAQAQKAWMEQLAQPYETVTPGYEKTTYSAAPMMDQVSARRDIPMQQTTTQVPEQRTPLLGRALRAEQARRLGQAPAHLQDVAQQEQLKMMLQKPDAPVAMGGGLIYHPETGQIVRAPADPDAVELKWYDAQTRRQAAEDRAEDKRLSREAREEARKESSYWKQQMYDLKKGSGEGGLKPAEKIRFEESMRKDFDKITKDARISGQHMAPIRAIREANPNYKLNNTQQQALIYSFNKLMDPTSAVREGEYNRTEQGMGLIQRLENFKDKVKEGSVVTPQVAKQIMDLMEEYAASSRKYYENTAREYGDLARERGLNERAVVTDRSLLGGPTPTVPTIPAGAVRVKGATPTPTLPAARAAANPPTPTQSYPAGAVRLKGG